MRPAALLLTAAAIVPRAIAHWVYPSLIVNGEVSGQWEFVRQNKNYNAPVQDLTSSDMVCNNGANDDDVLAKTKTKAVNAGDEIGFTIDSSVIHPGPMTVYMSKASSGVASYKGDGDWFKVYELTTSNINATNIQFAAEGIKNFTFTLPKELPTAEYLVRVERISLHQAGSKGGAQLYIACAQVSVTGSGSGTPGPTVKFPGAYTGNEPGILINIYWPVPTNYIAPGPATWPEACVDHTVNLLGQTSDGDCNGDKSAGAPSGSGTPVASGSPASSSGSSKPSGTSTTPETSETSTAAEDEGGCGATTSRRRARRQARVLI